jgi:hypothetical protein
MRNGLAVCPGKSVQSVARVTYKPIPKTVQSNPSTNGSMFVGGPLPGDEDLSVDDLLAPLDPAEFDLHHTELLSAVVSSSSASKKLEVVRDAGQGKGKGVFAAGHIEEGEVLFREPPLVRSCSHSSKPLVC